MTLASLDRPTDGVADVVDFSVTATFCADDDRRSETAGYGTCVSCGCGGYLESGAGCCVCGCSFGQHYS